MSDDDIQIIEKVTADPSCSGSDDVCQLCSRRLHGLTTPERKNHYKEHDFGKPTSKSRPKRARPQSVSASLKTTPMKLVKGTINATEDIFWYPAQAAAPPDNYSPGVLSILKDALKKSYTKCATQRAVLCYERTPHIYRESFDTSWGCGYRNFLMVCAALADQQYQTPYHQLLKDPPSPSVRGLQHWIEEAWKLGYDDCGARELKHKLSDTKEKIGTAELYVAFTSRKIPCILVDFNIKNSPKGFDTLIEWVVQYFTEKHDRDVNTVLRAASPVIATGKMPIIMQWDGHSVTIVGYELGKNGKYTLLVFDPSSKVDKGIRQAALGMLADADSMSASKRGDQSESSVTKKLRRDQDAKDDDIVSIHDSDDEKTDDVCPSVVVKSAGDPDGVIKGFRLKTLHKKKHDYQLLHFTLGDPLSDQEQDDRKEVMSERVC